MQGQREKEGNGSSSLSFPQCFGCHEHRPSIPEVQRRDQGGFQATNRWTLKETPTPACKLKAEARLAITDCHLCLLQLVHNQLQHALLSQSRGEHQEDQKHWRAKLCAPTPVLPCTHLLCRRSLGWLCVSSLHSPILVLCVGAASQPFLLGPERSPHGETFAASL